jgi:hypothetical protein
MANPVGMDFAFKYVFPFIRMDYTYPAGKPVPGSS